MNDSWKNKMQDYIAAWEAAKHYPTQVSQLKELDAAWKQAFKGALKDPNKKAATDKIWDESVALENQRVQLKEIDDKNSKNLQRIREEFEDVSKDPKKLDQLKKIIESQQSTKKKSSSSRLHFPSKL